MLLYQEIRQYLSSLIVEQPELKKLPSERVLQDKFNSTRITIREALSKLEAEGMIYRQNRKGWFICPARLKWDPVKKVNFYQLAKEQNFKASTHLVDILVEQSSDELTQHFDLATAAQTFKITRTRSLDERPVMVEQIHCLKEQFEGLEQKELEGSVTSIFEQDYGVQVQHESSTLYVTATPEDKAELLNLSSGSPCLMIIRRRYDGNNKLVDYNIEYWVYGAIEIEVTSK